MEVVTLKAEPRTARGRNQVARLRERGAVPAVVYGGKGETTSVVLAESDVERELRHHHRVFRLDLEGRQQGVLLKDVQFDVISDRALHLDFLRIDLDKPLRVLVDLFYVGHAKGASSGGVLVKDKVDVEIDSLPAAVPEHIEVHIGDLDIGDSIKVGELVLPPGVSLPDGSEGDIVCHMPAPTADDLEPEGAGEEGAVPEGGEPSGSGDES